MKPKTLLLSLLFVPYLIWLVTTRLTGLPLDTFLHSFIAGVSIIYAFGIIIWGIPYTTLVIWLLFWSRGKSAKELYEMLSRSPLLLAQITLAEFVLAYSILALVAVSQALFVGDGNKIDILELVGGFFGSIFYAFMAMAGIFIYGYIFVFFAKRVYEVFERWN
jgi:hypothetical protein